MLHDTNSAICTKMPITQTGKKIQKIVTFHIADHTIESGGRKHTLVKQDKKKTDKSSQFGIFLTRSVHRVAELLSYGHEQQAFIFYEWSILINRANYQALVKACFRKLDSRGAL